jgi:hypothetical protein
MKSAWGNKPADVAIADRRSGFEIALASLIRRLRPVSMGACHYCEWPVTETMMSTAGPLVPTCALCHGRLSNIFQVLDYAHPGCAI